ncbi:class I SAM-dependent methyltransferase [Patescibacteria group bacterium]|nr:MAG: class I SAM-dependent methyltransferase [Patescibacteria group bacterium]
MMHAASTLKRVLLEKAVKGTFFFRSRDYFNESQIWSDLARRNPVAAAIAADGESWEQKRSREAVNFLNSRLIEGVILDIGCGYGRIAKYLLQRRVFEGYIGLDGSSEMLRLFYERYQNSNLENRTPLLLILSGIDNIPLKSDSVSNAVVSAVFLHNPKKVTSLSIGEIYRVLKPGGKVFVMSSFFNKWSLRGLRDGLYLSFLILLGQGLRNGPVRYFSRKEVNNLFRGFRGVGIYEIGFEVVPKSIFLSKWNISFGLYRINRLFERICPAKWKGYFAVHFDIVACK